MSVRLDTGGGGQRTTLESLAPILAAHRRSILACLCVVAAVALGMLLREILLTYGDLGAVAIGGLLVLAVTGVGLALFVAPAMVVLLCAAAAFSTSSALLHVEYRLPLLLKYLPSLMLLAVAVQAVRRSRSALLPRRLWLEAPAPGGPSPHFLFCLSLLAAYFVITLASTLYATDLALAFDEMAAQRRHLALCLALALTVGRFGRWSSLESVTAVALYATTAVILLAALGSFVPALESVLPGFASVYDGDGTADDTAVRIAGAYGHPNTLGRYAVFMIPIAVCFILLSSGWRRVPPVACLLILVAGVTLSESRGALLVLMMIALPATVPMLRVVKVRHWLPAVLVGAIVIAASWQFVDTERMGRTVEDAGRFLESGEAPSDGATRGRLAEMRIAFELWRLHPFVGVGLANYEHHFQTYSYEFGTKLYNDDRAAHSLYLELLSERGIIGLLGYLGIFGAIVFTVLRGGVERLGSGARVEGSLIVAMVVATIAYYLSAMMLHDVHSSPIWALLGLMIASTRELGGAARRHESGWAFAVRT